MLHYPACSASNQLAANAAFVALHGVEVLSSGKPILTALTHKRWQNFGHHVIDIWFPAFRRLKMLETTLKRKHTPAILVVPKGCSQYDYSLAGKHASAAQHAQSCEQHMKEFAQWVGFSGYMAVNRTHKTCFDALLAGGMFQSSHASINQSEYEEYRDTCTSLNIRMLLLCLIHQGTCSRMQLTRIKCMHYLKRCSGHVGTVSVQTPH